MGSMDERNGETITVTRQCISFCCLTLPDKAVEGNSEPFKSEKCSGDCARLTALQMMRNCGSLVSRKVVFAHSALIFMCFCGKVTKYD